MLPTPGFHHLHLNAAGPAAAKRDLALRLAHLFLFHTCHTGLVPGNPFGPQGKARDDRLRLTWYGNQCDKPPRQPYRIGDA